ncbi:hypothetical protein, partial [Klebsiella pneumoniae]|uniref:hypothetical protein n=1 Tax=Klebsiella pneumoniae TaxID=573 RepID=UPI001D0EA8D7
FMKVVDVSIIFPRNPTLHYLEFSVKSYKYFTPSSFSMKNIFVQNGRAILIANFSYENVGIGTSL